MHYFTLYYVLGWPVIFGYLIHTRGAGLIWALQVAVEETSLAWVITIFALAMFTWPILLVQLMHGDN